jgi:hypothetical protein
MLHKYDVAERVLLGVASFAVILILGSFSF